MIRVLHVVTYMGRGGLETMLMNYYRHIDRSKVQFDFLVHREFEADYDEEIKSLGGRIYHVSRLVPWSRRYKAELRRFFRTHPEYKIVHVHQDCLSSVALQCAKECGIPVRIAHSHNSNQDKNIKYLFKRYYMRKIPETATELFACGKAAGDWMFGGKTYRLLPNAIAAEKYIYEEEKAKKIKKELDLEKNLVIGHIGRFNPQKNHKFLIDIFEKCFEKNQKVRLMLIGDGEGRKEIENKVKERGLQDNVIFPYILTSGVLKRKVAKDMKVDAVPGSIKATVAENTNLLTISVTDQDAGRAYATLKSVEKNYPSISEVIVGKVNMEMLDETGIPAEPDNPKAFRKNAVKGAAAGLLLVMIWTGILVVTRRTVRKESDIHRWMNTRCLGTVLEVHEKRRSRSTTMRMILTDPKVEEKMQESFRIIRNKIEYNAQEYHMKTFLVTSALAGEGKSTVAVNLALSLAQAGQRVTLVDCDLRHPTDRQILGIEENGVGLREVLEHKAKLKECLMKAEDIGLDPDMRMIFLPGGKTISDGSDLLGTELMGRIIEKLEEISDFVILDSAPAGLLTDAVVLAQYADGAAFVVRKDFARVDYIMDGMEHLAESNIQIIGGILNGV